MEFSISDQKLRDNLFPSFLFPRHFSLSLHFISQNQNPNSMLIRESVFSQFREPIRESLIRESIEESLIQNPSLKGFWIIKGNAYSSQVISMEFWFNEYEIVICFMFSECRFSRTIGFVDAGINFSLQV